MVRSLESKVSARVSTWGNNPKTSLLLTGATLLSPPVPSVCHILPISPIMNADNTAAVDSNENALLFNVALDETAVLLQSQECDVIE